MSDIYMASSLTEYPCRFHRELINISYKFRYFLYLNEINNSLLINIIFVEFPCKFHGKLI